MAARLSLAIFLILFSSRACAETIEVPHLPNGSVDLDALSFRVEFPISKGSDLRQAAGVMLGAPFKAHYSDGDLNTPFTLTISAPALSEEANYLIAVMLTDVICLQENLRPLALDWRNRAKKQATDWQVTASCSNEARQPAGGPPSANVAPIE